MFHLLTPGKLDSAADIADDLANVAHFMSCVAADGWSTSDTACAGAMTILQALARNLEDLGNELRNAAKSASAEKEDVAQKTTLAYGQGLLEGAYCWNDKPDDINLDAMLPSQKEAIQAFTRAVYRPPTATTAPAPDLTEPVPPGKQQQRVG